MKINSAYGLGNHGNMPKRIFPEIAMNGEEQWTKIIKVLDTMGYSIIRNVNLRDLENNQNNRGPW